MSDEHHLDEEQDNAQRAQAHLEALLDARDVDAELEQPQHAHEPQHAQYTESFHRVCVTVVFLQR